MVCVILSTGRPTSPGTLQALSLRTICHLLRLSNAKRPRKMLPASPSQDSKGLGALDTGVQGLIGNISHRCNFREFSLPSYRTHSFLSLVSLFLKASICSGPPLSLSIRKIAGCGDIPWEGDGKIRSSRASSAM